MQPELHLKRAAHHLASARLTMEAGYFDVTVNRAYYAAFEAARAVLRAMEIPLPKSHRGLSTQFMQHAVFTGKIDQEIGGLLGQLETDRLVADYEGDLPDVEEAQFALSSAEALVEAVRAEFLPELDLRVGDEVPPSL